jgi:hypothetical protein
VTKRIGLKDLSPGYVFKWPFEGFYRTVVSTHFRSGDRVIQIECLTNGDLKTVYGLLHEECLEEQIDETWKVIRIDEG